MTTINRKKIHILCYIFYHSGEQHRGRADFLILRDEINHKEESHNITVLLARLKTDLLRGAYIKDIRSPGMTPDVQLGFAISDADYIIAFFESVNISSIYIDHLKRSHQSKLHQRLEGHIIPVFSEMVNEACDVILNKSSLSLLNLYQSLSTLEDKWIDKIIKRLTTPSLGKYTIMT